MSTRKPTGKITKTKIEGYVKAYNAAVRQYNAQSKKDYNKIRQNTPAGRAAAERLRKLYNKVADKGKTLKAAVNKYQG